jgi:gliding motility-associated lipoprotein GldH
MLNDVTQACSIVFHKDIDHQLTTRRRQWPVIRCLNYLYKKFTLKNFCYIVLLAMFLSSCQKIDVYEKTKLFPEHSWSSKERPSFTFEISDTTSLYNILLVVRHTDAYNYNNIWVNMDMKGPHDSLNVRREFVLANSAGWLGSGMDDIYEHRVPFNDKPAPLQKGVYTFTLKQDMREDPLDNVLNVGIRVQKVK